MISVSMQREEGGLSILEFRASADFTAAPGLLPLGEFPYAELFQAARNAGARDAGESVLPEDFFAYPRSRLFHVNGWQSWSFAGELRWSERPRRACVKRALNLYVDHPAEAELRALARIPSLPERGQNLGAASPGAAGRLAPGRLAAQLARGRPDHISHFFAVLRDGDARLGLVSMGSAAGLGASGSRPAPANEAVRVSRQSPPVSFLLGKDSVRAYAYAEGGSFNRGEIIARIALVPARDGFSLKDAFARLFSGARPGLSALFASTSRPRLGGYETWYSHYLGIDESVVAADLGACSSGSGLISALFPRDEGRTIFQIDDGWERTVGDWRPDPSKFPGGMKAQADAIREAGFVPGLWFAPFLLMPGCPLAEEKPGWILKDDEGKPVIAGWNPGWGGDVWCLDLSLPEVEEHILGFLGTACDDWGFSYLKLDFLYAGLMRGKRAGRPGGAWEHYSRIISAIALGNPGVQILSCGAPIEATAPYAPLMRVGADTREHWDWPILRAIGHQGRPSAMVNLQHSIGRAILDGSVLYSDPDVVFLGGGGEKARKSSLGEKEKYLIALVAWMFGSQIMSSDMPSAKPGQASGAASDPKPIDLEKGILDYCRRMGEGDFWVERLYPASSGLYGFRSRDGRIYGAVNLSSRTRVFAFPAPGSAEAPKEESCVIPGRSILVFGLPEKA